MEHIINGEKMPERNIMKPTQLKNALKRAKSIQIVDLHHGSFQRVAIPIKGKYQIVMLNEAGTHVRLEEKGPQGNIHYNTMPLSTFVDIAENVLELAKNPEIRDVFKGRLEELVPKYKAI